MTSSQTDNLPPLSDTYANNLLLRLIACPGTTGNEQPIANLLQQELVAIGVPKSAIFQDEAHKKIPLPTPCGNLIVRLSGNAKGPTILFSTHMDTVPLCEGAVPIFSPDKSKIIPQGKTALGGDNRTGCAVLVHLAAQLLQTDKPRPNITLLFTVREESGLHGARNLDTALLGDPAFGFNVDGGEPAKFIRGAVGAERWEAEIEGIASHAGVHPDKGVSATLVASLALAEAHQGGWFGKVVQGKHQGSSNAGILCGRNGGSVGDATNVVTDYLLMRGESRSFDSDFANQITKSFEGAIANAIKKVTTSDGKTGSFRFKSQQDYTAFEIPEDSEVAQRAIRAARIAGLNPRFELGRGGLDSNWIVQHGIPSLTFGAGQHEIHTVSEYVDMGEFHAGCQLALALALGN